MSPPRSPRIAARVTPRHAHGRFQERYAAELQRREKKRTWENKARHVLRTDGRRGAELREEGGEEGKKRRAIRKRKRKVSSRSPGSNIEGLIRVVSRKLRLSEIRSASRRGVEQRDT